MPTEQRMYECKQCGKMTPHIVQKRSHLLHLFLTVVTLGLWIPVWIILVLAQHAPQCVQCGGRYTGFRVS